MLPIYHEEIRRPAISIPTLADIEQTSELENNVIRNLQITQCYHELSKILAERTDGIYN
jgi:hypothetical protein